MCSKFAVVAAELKRKTEMAMEWEGGRWYKFPTALAHHSFWLWHIEATRGSGAKNFQCITKCIYGNGKLCWLQRKTRTCQQLEQVAFGLDLPK